jgi:hypothetical protein
MDFPGAPPVPCRNAHVHVTVQALLTGPTQAILSPLLYHLLGSMSLTKFRRCCICLADLRGQALLPSQLMPALTWPAAKSIVKMIDSNVTRRIVALKSRLEISLQKLMTQTYNKMSVL